MHEKEEIILDRRMPKERGLERRGLDRYRNRVWQPVSYHHRRTYRSNWKTFQLVGRNKRKTREENDFILPHTFLQKDLRTGIA
jgi:hypothetical protein